MGDQRGAWDVSLMNHLKEATFGETPTSGTWLPVSLVKSFEPRYMPTFKPKVGIGRQNPSNWTLIKEYYEFDIELEVIKREASPDYNWYKLVQYILEKDATADGSPDNLLDSFSLSATIDLVTDEFWHLMGCMLDRVDLIGSSVDDLVTMKLHGIAQDGDYSTTDPVSGTATRRAQPADLYQIGMSECDVLYSKVPAAVASIMDDISSFRLSMIRTLDKRGTDGTTDTLYRAFVPKDRRWEVEITKDFDSRTELEHFIDASKVDCTIEIPNEALGLIFTLEDGFWKSPSGVPVRELDLLNLRLVGEFADLTIGGHT